MQEGKGPTCIETHSTKLGCEILMGSVVRVPQYITSGHLKAPSALELYEEYECWREGHRLHTLTTPPFVVWTFWPVKDSAQGLFDLIRSLD